MPISEKQKKILAFPYTKNYQALICDGSVRSGKSSIMAVAFVDWAMRDFDGCNFGICGKTVGSTIKNIIKPYMALTYHANKYNIKFTGSNENVMVVRQGRKVNRFYVYGGKDERSYTLIQGITLAGVLLDEVALMPRSFVEQALARCLSYPNRRYWFNCNPEYVKHWFNQEWIVQSEKHKALHLHFTMEDNPILTAETIEEANRTWSGVFHDRYVKGLWVNAQGIIYRLFADNPARYFLQHTMQDGTINPEFPRLIEVNAAFDPGGTKSNHAFVATGITAGYNQLIALRSECHKADGTTAKDIDIMAVNFVGKVIAKYGRCDYLYYDNEASVLGRGIKEAVENAYPMTSVMPCYKGIIRDRIDFTSRMLGLDRFKYTEDCNTLKEALEQAVWDDKRDDVRLDDNTSDVDTLDGLEYTFSNQMKRFIVQ